MNSIIKRVVVSVALLQTVCSQAFTEFVNVNELAGRVTEQVAQEAPKGYMEMACDLWSRRPSMPESVSFAFETAKTFVTPYAKSVSEAVAPHITLQNGKYAAAGVAVLAGLYVVRNYIENIPVDKHGNPIIVQGHPAPTTIKEQIIDAVLEGRIAEAKKLVANNAVLTPEEKNNAIRLIDRYFSFTTLPKQDSHNQDQSNLVTKTFELLDKALDKLA